MPPPASGRKGRPYNSQGTCFLYGLIPRRRRSTLARMVSALPWQICLVFPRLDLPWAMHGSHLCLVPGHDPRLEGRSADPQVAYLLAQSDAPEAALSPEAQADFVAACALSCLLPGGLDALDSRGDGEPQIHAGAFSGRPLDAESAPEQPEESLAPEGKLTAPLGDLLEALFTRWTRHHVEGDGRRGWEGTALFRSAAMALRAFHGPARRLVGCWRGRLASNTVGELGFEICQGPECIGNRKGRPLCTDLQEPHFENQLGKG